MLVNYCTSFDFFSLTKDVANCALIVPLGGCLPIAVSYF